MISVLVGCNGHFFVVQLGGLFSFLCFLKNSCTACLALPLDLMVNASDRATNLVDLLSGVLDLPRDHVKCRLLVLNRLQFALRLVFKRDFLLSICCEPMILPNAIISYARCGTLPWFAID